MSNSLQPRGLQHARLLCPSLSPGVCSNSCPLSVIPSNHLILCRPFFSCPQSFPASRSSLMSRLFALGGQSIGTSASASVLPMNIQDWFSLGLTGLISLQSKGLTRVFSSTTVWKHQFFGASLSLRSMFSSSHLWMWELDYLKKAECQRMDAFKMWCWKRLLRVPWTVSRSNQSVLREIHPEYSLEGLRLKLKLQYFGHLMWRTDSLEKTLMLGKIEGRRRGW